MYASLDDLWFLSILKKKLQNFENRRKGEKKYVQNLNAFIGDFGIIIFLSEFEFYLDNLCNSSNANTD